MRKCVFAINSVEKGININVKSIYREDGYDKYRFDFKITNDTYYGYVFVVKGKVTLTTTDSYNFDVHEGESVFVWSNDIRSYIVHEEGTQFYWVWFSLQGAVLPLMNVYKLSITNRDIEKLNGCIKLLRKATAISAARVNITFEKYVLDLLEALQNNAGSTGSHHRITILKSAEYIRENIGELPTVQDIANLFGMSFKQYRKRFVRYLGVYPAKYIYTQKLDFAREYLINTDQSISSISDTLGFSNQFYFSRCFKSEFGCSPSDYRKKVKDD